MDERSALAATALEAFETAEPRSPSWTTPTVPGPIGSPSTRRRQKRRSTPSCGLRAGHALQRLGPREPALGRLLGASLRETRWTVAAAALAFVVGLFIDSLAGSHRINLLAPPMWGVLAWNGFVYLGLLVWPLVRLSRAAATKTPRADRPRRRRADPSPPSRAAPRRRRRGGVAACRRRSGSSAAARSRRGAPRCCCTAPPRRSRSA
jgi:hypothetical protein